jgi:hypothetical protein
MKNDIVQSTWDYSHSSTLDDVLGQVASSALSRGMPLYTPNSDLRADTETSLHSDLSREYYQT